MRGTVKCQNRTRNYTAASRPSTIQNPVLQLQQSGPLPPEAVSLLQLGPNFAFTANEIPEMDVVVKVEKVCLNLESGLFYKKMISF